MPKKSVGSNPKIHFKEKMQNDAKLTKSIPRRAYSASDRMGPNLKENDLQSKIQNMLNKQNQKINKCIHKHNHIRWTKPEHTERQQLQQPSINQHQIRKLSKGSQYTKHIVEQNNLNVPIYSNYCNKKINTASDNPSTTIPSNNSVWRDSQSKKLSKTSHNETLIEYLNMSDRENNPYLLNELAGIKQNLISIVQKKENNQIKTQRKLNATHKTTDLEQTLSSIKSLLRQLHDQQSI